MPDQIDVFYNGRGEPWRWGRLMSSDSTTGRPQAVPSILERVCSVASTFTASARSQWAGQITPGTLRLMQGWIDDNIWCVTKQLRPRTRPRCHRVLIGHSPVSQACTI